MTRRLNCLRRLQPQKRTPPEGGQRGSKLGRTQEEFLSCRLYHRAPMRGTNIGASGLTDALLDTINLRVWDAGRPRWVSPFPGASSAAQREPREAGRLCPVSNPHVPSQTPKEEMSESQGGGCR